MATEAEIRKALEEVTDPELLLSVVDLGMVRAVRVGEGGAPTEVDLLLTTPFCPYGPVLVDQVRAVVEQVTGGPAAVEVLSDPWDPSMMPDPSLLGHW
ncbi:MAG TPA: metal-sulfur cluster assembly factor [Candidatus Saccharimonadales bacterium]|nr:metal-sulfur cluster assembly factor [Candidatus Saccharimonadales bacterium]